LHIDAGASAALQAGKSLLPIGVTSIDGEFERGDCVAIIGPDGFDMARGLTAYASASAARIIGRQSSEIVSLLGYNGRSEMIHRDDLVMSQTTSNGK
jgi:glutamate 5-kinase